MHTLLWIILATLVVSAVSLVGVLTLGMQEKKLKKILMILIALSAGVLIGSAFLDLIPEAIHNNSGSFIFIYVLVGFGLFFFIEKVLHWRHCHDRDCKVHSFAYMSMIGDSVHNFIDGMIIAASFVVNIPLGFVTTVAVTLHEIPQEIGDFAILVHGGYKKNKALLLNFMTALTAVAGGIIGYYLASFASASIDFLIPFAAGGFIYIAASDLIPELRKENDFKKLLINFGVFLLGIVLVYSMTLLGVG